MLQCRRGRTRQGRRASGGDARAGSRHRFRLTFSPGCLQPAFAQTPGQIGGIHYRRSPLRHDVVFAGLTGTRLTLQGLVLSTSCRPVTGARIDFWQADTSGHYDDTGTRLRSHQFTDARGRYHLETILPGPYPGRTRHMHVKVRAPGQRTLTTELYFPGALYNDRDPYFDKRLLVHLAEVHKTFGRELRLRAADPLTKALTLLLLAAALLAGCGSSGANQIQVGAARTLPARRFHPADVRSEQSRSACRSRSSSLQARL